jgi:hypothetical protein
VFETEADAAARPPNPPQTTAEAQVWYDRHAAILTRYLTDAARARTGVKWARPPYVDPARVGTMTIAISGDRATATTVEQDPFDRAVPYEAQYRLRFEDGEWRIDDRWLRKPGDGWERGQL